MASEHPGAEVLYSLNYTQQYHVPTPTDAAPTVGATDDPAPSTPRSGLLHLQDLSPSLALEDEVLRNVKRAWDVITADDGEARGPFMMFGEREGIGEDEGVGEE